MQFGRTAYLQYGDFTGLWKMMWIVIMWTRGSSVPQAVAMHLYIHFIAFVFLVLTISSLLSMNQIYRSGVQDKCTEKPNPAKNKESQIYLYLSSTV